MQIGLGLSITAQLRFGSAIPLSAYAVNNFDPSLVFDFEQNYYRTGDEDSTLSSSVTHTRASSATMTNSSGNIVTVGNNVARVGHHIYNGNAWANEGVLHESEARTNFYLNSSETSTNSSFNITKTSDSAVSPDGTTTADLITPINAGRHLFQYSSSYSAGDGSTETYSFYAKSNGYNLFEVSQRNQSGGTVTKFDLSAVTATTTSGTEIFKSIEDVGNGWYRCSASYITSSVNPYPAVEFLDTDGSQGFTADGTSSIYFWGHQLEAGSTQSSYIPTSGSTVTRAAETLTVSAANLPYSSTNMSIQMDGRMTGDNLTPIRWFEDANNAILLETGTNNFTFTQEVGGTVDTVTGGSYTSGLNVPFNMASRHGSTFINGATDGTALTANTTPTSLPDLSTTDLQLGQSFMGTIGKFRVWNKDLTDTGIATASAPTFTDEFAMTVTTTTANETFTIPCRDVGTFDAGIEWGDGSVSTVTAYNSANLTHTYATAGDHLIRITGSFPNIYFTGGYVGWADRLKVKSVDNLGTVGWVDLEKAFNGCSNMTSFTSGTTDTSSVTSMKFMFNECESLTELDCSSFDTSSVTDFNFMFYSCNSLTELDCSSFDTSSNPKINSMFENCLSLTALDVSNFSSVSSLQRTFKNCRSLTSLDCSSFNTSGNMKETFRSCGSNVTHLINVSGWDTSSVTNMYYMFANMNTLTDVIGIEDFNIESVTTTNFFIAQSTLPTSRYDALLVNFDAQDPIDGKTWNFGGSKYTAGSAAATARANLISNDGWIIQDGGTA